MKQAAKIVRLLACLCLPVLTSGCIAKAIVDTATLPVKAASKGWDVATTSQSEADEKRGRAMRHREEELGKLDRRRSKAMQECHHGDGEACRVAQQLDATITALENQPS